MRQRLAYARANESAATDLQQQYERRCFPTRFGVTATNSHEAGLRRIAGLAVRGLAAMLRKAEGKPPPSSARKPGSSQPRGYEAPRRATATSTTASR